MQLDHSFTVPAGLDDAWKLFQELDRVAPCMPGAVLDTLEGDSFTGRVKVKVGAVQMSYRGEGTVTRDGSARSMLLDLSGSETRGAGTASATVTATLTAAPAGTLVRVRTDLDITGRPAAIRPGHHDRGRRPHRSAVRHPARRAAAGGGPWRVCGVRDEHHGISTGPARTRTGGHRPRCGCAARAAQESRATRGGRAVCGGRDSDTEAAFSQLSAAAPLSDHAPSRRTNAFSRCKDRTRRVARQRPLHETWLGCPGTPSAATPRRSDVRISDGANPSRTPRSPSEQRSPGAAPNRASSGRQKSQKALRQHPSYHPHRALTRRSDRSRQVVCPFDPFRERKQVERATWCAKQQVRHPSQQAPESPRTPRARSSKRCHRGRGDRNRRPKPASRLSGRHVGARSVK